MKLALTFNIKKENNNFDDVPKNLSVKNNHKECINENLILNYSERLDDTYAEWDTEETISAVRSALEAWGHDVCMIEADHRAYEQLKSVNPEFVFNIAEGFDGPSRESQIPSILEMLKIPFTGSDSITIGLCHDKSRCKEILSYYKIPNADFFITDNLFDLNKEISFPKFVKPLYEGSSKGIYNSSVVNNLTELKDEIMRIKECYNQPSLIENFLTGKEFTVAMLGNGDDVRTLPIIEINLDSVPSGFNKIYSYEVKWFFDTRENTLDIFRCPAEINEELYNQIEKTCRRAYSALRIKDWARIDVRLDENGVPNIVEVNPLPGILPDPADNSCYPKAARRVGMDYNTLINEVLNVAVARYNIN